MSTCFYVTNQDKGLFVRQGLHHKNKMMFLEKQSIDPSGFNVYVRKERKKKKMAFWLTSPQLSRSELSIFLQKANEYSLLCMQKIFLYVLHEHLL